MSTGNMPNPPTNPTSQAVTGDPQAQASVASPSDTQVQAQAQPPFNLADDMAGIIEGNADIIAQRLVYHSQTMFGVGATGVDVVNAHNSAMVVANALRNSAASQAVWTLVNLGDGQVCQVNDQTLPFKNNAQVAGLLEGLIFDTVARVYADNPDRIQEARTLLNGYFQPANELMQVMARQLDAIQALAPGPGPNARS